MIDMGFVNVGTKKINVARRKVGVILDKDALPYSPGLFVKIPEYIVNGK